MKTVLKFFFLVSFYTSCSTKDNSSEQTKRSSVPYKMIETEIKLPIKNNFITFNHFASIDTEYLSYLDNNKIVIKSLLTNDFADSINVLFNGNETDKYGDISSYCFSGSDSLFVLFDKAVFFIKRKKLEKIIPINSLDTIQFNGQKFTNLEDVPIYFNKLTNEIIGQVYCSKCSQSDSVFYRQKNIGKINISTNKLYTSSVTYPEKYINSYFGFANKVYSDSYDSTTVLSFPCDDKVYVLDNVSDKLQSFFAKSIFQKIDFPTLPKSESDSREGKMRHLVTVPYYSEIKYDPYRKLYYRFFLKDIKLKKDDGQYNSFSDKGLVLMVINSDFEVIGEYELDKYYNNYISFVGKSGLYINYFSKNILDKGNKVFKILNFKQ